MKILNEIYNEYRSKAIWDVYLLAASINMGHEAKLKNVLLILVNFTCKL